jgi:hypothetical protein
MSLMRVVVDEGTLTVARTTHPWSDGPGHGMMVLIPSSSAQSYEVVVCVGGTSLRQQNSYPSTIREYSQSASSQPQPTGATRTGRA